MARKCPPGVFCIDNITLFILACIAIAVLYMIYKQTNNNRDKDRTLQVTTQLLANPELFCKRSRIRLVAAGFSLQLCALIIPGTE